MNHTKSWLLIFSWIFFSCNQYQGTANLINSGNVVNIAQQKVAIKTKTDDGHTLYLKYCLACHQTDGSGVPGMYPPLQNSDWVNGDKNRIINLLINGLQGEIKVNDEVYEQVMPKQAALTNKQIAQVLSYVRMHFENHSDSVKVKEVISVRKTIK